MDINASPDLRVQIQATPALRPRGGLRGSPISAVILTGAEVDQTAGLLTLREHQSFALFATGETLATLAANPIFGVLAAGVVTRQRIRPDRPFVLPGGLHAELFAVPGKVALYFEGKKLRTEPGIHSPAMSARPTQSVTWRQPMLRSLRSRPCRKIGPTLTDEYDCQALRNPWCRPQ